MAEAAKALGMGGSITYKDKKYLLAPFNVDMIGMFEVWLEEQAWEKVERTKGRCSPDIYQDRMDSVTKQVTGQQFSYGSPIAAAAAMSIPGQKYILFLMMKFCPENEGVTEKLAHDIFEEKKTEALARMQSASFDPNSEAPTTASGNPSVSPTSAPSSPESHGA